MSGLTRWWESYLVRYFMPSIAGMIFVIWLYQSGSLPKNPQLAELISQGVSDFGASHLILWILFGSFYCYLASYPILVFHATRAADFKDVQGRNKSILLNPYNITFTFCAVQVGALYFNCFLVSCLALVLFVIFQFAKIHSAVQIKEYGFKSGFDASLAYAYLSKLSKRRSVESTQKIKREDLDDEGEVEKETKNDSKKSDQLEEGDKKGDQSEEIKMHKREKDLSDSYRHLREHGNTALIFVLEVALFPIMFFMMKLSADNFYTVLVLVLAVWTAPAAYVHWLGQHLERRFSLFKH